MRNIDSDMIKREKDALDRHYAFIDTIRQEVPEIYDYELIGHAIYFYMQVKEKVRVAHCIFTWMTDPHAVILILKDTLEKAKKREIPVVDYNPYVESAE